MEVMSRNKICEYVSRCCIPIPRIDFMYYAHVNYVFPYRSLTPCEHNLDSTHSENDIDSWDHSHQRTPYGTWQSRKT